MSKNIWKLDENADFVQDPLKDSEDELEEDEDDDGDLDEKSNEEDDNSEEAPKDDLS